VRDAPRRVQFFRTCLVNDFFPSAGIAAVELLERAGVTVEVPAGQTCCGQPAFNAGFRDEARAVAKHTLELLSRSDGPIVTPSGSCADMLVHQTHELFRGDESRAPDGVKWSEKAASVAKRCFELTQFVVDQLGVASIREPAPARAAKKLRVAYHPSCHLSRGLGVKSQPRELLAELARASGSTAAAIELVPLQEEEECCGFGGMFSVKQPEISGAMLDRKCTAIEKARADVVASCDSGCLLHLAGGLRRRGSDTQVCHVAELLNRSANRSRA
jgi:L-lactate dehydrogenase complex protein LldE